MMTDSVNEHDRKVAKEKEKTAAQPKTYTAEEFNHELVKRMDEWRATQLQYSVVQNFKMNDSAPNLVITIEGGDVKELRLFGLQLEKQITEWMTNRYDDASNSHE
jgi:hypothetical protein